MSGVVWALVLTIATPNHGDEYVIDSFKDVGDCVAALQRHPNQHTRTTHRTWTCEKTRIVKR